MAFNLGITLDKLYEMSSKEYMGWIEYFKQRPVGWQADHRAALLLQTTYQGKQKIDFSEYFPSLKSISKANENTINKAKAFISQIQGLSKSKNKIDLK